MTSQHAFHGALIEPGKKNPLGLTARHGADVSNRFAVYRNNVFVSLIDALADTFQATQLLVGEDFFRAMAREFVMKTKPRSPILTYYGDEFPDFIDNFPPADSLPYLSDVARLEYKYVLAFHSDDAQAYPTEQLSELLSDPESLASKTLTLHPSAQIVSSQHAIVSIWEAHQQKEPSLKNISPSEPESAFIVRSGLEVLLCRTNLATTAFIKSLLAGKSLGTSAEECMSLDKSFDLAEALSLLIRTHAIIHVS